MDDAAAIIQGFGSGFPGVALDDLEGRGQPTVAAQALVGGARRGPLSAAGQAARAGGGRNGAAAVAPILQQVSGFSASSISLILLVYGVSVAVGNIWGGKLADRKGAIPALKILFSGLAAILLALTFTASHPLLVVLTVLVWGGFAFGNVPALRCWWCKKPSVMRRTPWMWVRG